MIRRCLRSCETCNITTIIVVFVTNTAHMTRLLLSPSHVAVRTSAVVGLFITHTARHHLLRHATRSPHKQHSVGEGVIERKSERLENGRQGICRRRDKGTGIYVSCCLQEKEQIGKEGMDEKRVALTAIILPMRGALQRMHDITSPCIVQRN